MHKWVMIVLCAFASMTVMGNSVDQAIAHAHRSEADRKADVHRHPKAVLEFAAIKSGHIVLDVFAGGGYYSELIAHIVGMKGKVTAFNNPPYLNFVGDQLKQRLSDNTLPQVQRLDVDADALKLEANQFDRIVASMAFHDLYYSDPANGWPDIDAAQMYQTLFRSLKSGGFLVVIDHSAHEGSGASSAQSLHRIEEAFLLNDLIKAGFILDETSDALRNPNDRRELSSFEPRIRYQTDRFLWRLKKP